MGFSSIEILNEICRAIGELACTKFIFPDQLSIQYYVNVEYTMPNIFYYILQIKLLLSMFCILPFQQLCVCSADIQLTFQWFFGGFQRFKDFKAFSIGSTTIRDCWQLKHVISDIFFVFIAANLGFLLFASLIPFTQYVVYFVLAQ